MLRSERQNAAEQKLQNQENLLPRNRLIIVVTCLSLVMLFSIIDQNGISVTLPTIARDLDAADTISWAGTSSLIANTVFSVLYGRLSDIFGRKWVFLGACILLAVADLLCGLAQNAPMLYVFRALAGLSGGGIANLTMIIVSDIVTLEERGKYQGIIGAIVGFGNVVGPFLAAGFSESLTWRGFFWFLAPALTICAVVAPRFLPSTRSNQAIWDGVRKIDWVGCFLSSVAIVLILIPISGGGLYFQWNSPMVISMLVIGSCLFLAFLIYEWRMAHLPMIPLQIFNSRSVSALLAQSFLLGWSYQSLVYYMPQYYQNVRGYDTVRSAALSIPIVVMQSIFSIISGQYISRRKRYGEVIWAGFFCWTVGSVIVTAVFGRSTHPAICVVALSIIGAGVGNAFQPTLVALQVHSSKRHRAVIISARNFCRACGGAFGLAASAGILQASFRANLQPQDRDLVNYVYSLPDTLRNNDSLLDAYMASIRNVFIMNSAVIGVCLLACVLVKDTGLQRSESSDSPTLPQQSSDTMVTGGGDKRPETDAVLDCESGSDSVSRLDKPNLNSEKETLP
ncbi:major facilitator superfamily domain-containing protein [Hypoxylon cercidicola]|nr:major facilitator superfamily domain-containing protein [Hypoxylon cercidicola]